MRSMLRLRLRGLDRSAPAARLLSVPAAITWEAMRLAKAQGLRWFNFGGLRAPTLRALLDGEANSEQAASVDRFTTPGQWIDPGVHRDTQATAGQFLDVAALPPGAAYGRGSRGGTGAPLAPRLIPRDRVQLSTWNCFPR